MNVAGTDVSAKTVTLVISRDERLGKPRELKNTSQGHVTLSNRLCRTQIGLASEQSIYGHAGVEDKTAQNP